MALRCNKGFLSKAECVIGPPAPAHGAGGFGLRRETIVILATLIASGVALGFLSLAFERQS
jgi:hypothetical protein